MASEDDGAQAAESTLGAGVATVEGNGHGHHGGNGIGHDLLSAADPRQLATSYESFDRLVQDTTAHSAELLRRVLALPTLAAREVSQVRAAAETRIQSEQEWQRSLLTSLLDEFTAGRQRAEQLAAGVADLLRDFGALSDRAGAALDEIASRPPTLEAGAEAETAAEVSATGGEASAPAEETAGRAVSLVVHGARPTTALSLRRYLAGLPHVASVKVREYAGDALHAQLAVDRPLTTEDFRAWGNGSGLEVVSPTDDAVELRLTDAAVPA